MIDKISILLLVILLLIEAEARVCHHNGHGFTKYYYCSPHEYCCGDTCCTSYLRLSFYRLWYFWLTVIMILIFCSGSGYWFRRRYYNPDLFMGTSHSHNSTGGLVIRRDSRPLDRTESSGTRVNGLSARPVSPPSYSVQGAPVQSPGYAAYQMYGPPPSYDAAVYPTQGPPAYSANPDAAQAAAANQSAPTTTRVALPANQNAK